MFKEHEERILPKDLMEGDKVVLKGKLCTYEGWFHDGHEFTFNGNASGHCWFSDDQNRHFRFSPLDISNPILNFRFIKKEESK